MHDVKRQCAQDHLISRYAKASPRAVQCVELSLMHPSLSVTSQAGVLSNSPCNIAMGIVSVHFQATAT